jgi:hypothetical protein
MHMAEARRPAHCRHCAGDGCSGDCILDEYRCIHGWNGKHPRQFQWGMLLSRRWWRQALWGSH